MLKFRMSAKKKNPTTFEVYNSDRESVKFANCVEIPDEYEMEIMSAKKKKKIQRHLKFITATANP